MNWFDILKQQVEPHDIVTRRHDLFFKIGKLPEYKDKSREDYGKVAYDLKWSLINAAFFNTPIPSKERILLRKLIPYTEMGNESRIFNTVSTAGNRGIRKLPFDLNKENVALMGNSSRSFVRRLYARFTLFISKKEIKFKLGKLHINDWYTSETQELTKDTAEFIRIWKYMRGYTDVLMDFEVVYLGTNIKTIKPYEQYSKFGLPKDFASTGGNVSKEGLDKFIENVRKHYSQKSRSQEPFDIGFIENPKGDEE